MNDKVELALKAWNFSADWASRPSRLGITLGRTKNGHLDKDVKCLCICTKKRLGSRLSDIHSMDTIGRDEEVNGIPLDTATVVVFSVDLAT